MRELVGLSTMSLLKVLVLFCVMMYGGATLNLEDDNIQISTGLPADAAFSVIPSLSNTSSITPLINLSSKEEFSRTTLSFPPTTSTTPTVPTTPTPSPTTTAPTTTPPSTTPPSTTAPSTTAPSTTTSSTTTSSTTAPSTTAPSTTAPSTTTPAPLHPVVTNWTVVDEENNVTCLVVKLVASFDIPYVNVDGKSENATIVLPGNATSNGTCNMDNMEDSNRQAISLQWVVDKEDSPNMLTLVFQKNISSAGSERNIAKEQFYLSDMILQIYPDSANFPNYSNVSFIFGKHLNGNLFPVEVNSSYRCNSEQTVELDFGANTGFAHFTNVQFEAFRSQMNDKFSTAMDCSADKIFTSDIVPIAVGCALAALVVIVLVAYLIGRRRARQRGYQSV